MAHSIRHARVRHWSFLEPFIVWEDLYYIQGRWMFVAITLAMQSLEKGPALT